MKLKIYNKENCRGYSSKPFVSFGKSGYININAAAVTLMKLENGGGIEFANDETSQDSEDWYLIKSKSEDAFILRDKDNGCLAVQSSKLTAEIMRSLGCNGNIRVPISSNPVKIDKMDAWLLLTSAVIEKETR